MSIREPSPDCLKGLGEDVYNTIKRDGAALGFRNISSITRLLDESFNFLLWSDSSGYCICLAPDDCETICSIVRFSEELELLEATGIVPIPAIDLKDQEKWVGKTEAEFIEQYGYCHFDFGSGIYMPNYIAETGEIYWFTVENGVIVRFRSYFVNQ